MKKNNPSVTYRDMWCRRQRKGAIPQIYTAHGYIVQSLVKHGHRCAYTTDVAD